MHEKYGLKIRTWKYEKWCYADLESFCFLLVIIGIANIFLLYTFYYDSFDFIIGGIYDNDKLSESPGAFSECPGCNNYILFGLSLDSLHWCIILGEKIFLGEELGKQVKYIVCRDRVIAVNGYQNCVQGIEK